MRGMDLGSAALDGSVFLDWWTGVVLLAPDEVPDGGDEYEGEEDNGGVVHGFGCDGEVRWHAEEGHSESGPGKCNDVAHETEDSHVELSVLDVRTTTDKGHGNRHCVGNSQADNTNTRESVECSRGSEVQDTEDDLDCHTEHHGIEWDIKLRVDNLPPLETWDGSITGESPCGAGSGSGASNAAEEGEDHKRDTQGECASLAADCLYNDDGCWLTGSEVEEILKIWEDEEKRDKEDKSTDGVENDGSDHGLRNLYARVLHFFAHGDNHAGRRSGVCCLQEADTESPSWSPARQRLKFSEDELC